MRNWLAGSIALSIILKLIFMSVPVRAVQDPRVASSTFCYDRVDPDCPLPANWTGTCKAGKEQSPINIPVSKTQAFQKISFRLNKEYIIETKQVYFGQNNGHTVQFELNPDTSALMSDLKICGGHLEHCYKFAQLHFHWGNNDREGSEHTVNGQSYPLELHLVHYRDKYKTLTDALNSKDRQGVAVMGIFFKIGSHNKALDSIIKSLIHLKNPNHRRTKPNKPITSFIFPLRISDFYPIHAKFAYYHGSLTTPGCAEMVVWTVFLESMTISLDQMKQFHMLSFNEGISSSNFRPVLPLNGRKIKYYQVNGFSEIDVKGKILRNSVLNSNSNCLKKKPI